MLKDEHLKEVFSLIDSKLVAKEAIPDILEWICKNPNRTVKEGIEALGLKPITPEELEQIVDKVLEERAELVKSSGNAAYSQLMGILMSRLRGRIDASLVSEVLRRRLSEFVKRR